jgi:alpha-1,6-mannosyltransferase
VAEPVHVVDTTMFWSPTGGGVRRYLQTKHAWLAQQPGWRHTLAVPLVAGEPVGPATLPSLPLPASGGYRLPLRRAAMARVLDGLAPDLIEAGDPYRVAWAARDAARRRGCAAVAYCHSNLASMARLAAGPRFGATAARWAERYARRVYDGFDLVLAPSRSMAAHLADWGVARVACQPLGVDTRAFHPTRADPAWRLRHGWPASTRLLVYAGRFAAEKHLDVLAAAVERLGSPYALAVIGAGPVPPPRSARVVVLPFLDTAELATALASADAFVHAGDQETFGLSVLEALACGTPAVVRAAEGLGELVDGAGFHRSGDGPVGVAVHSGTAAAFAEAITALFEHDAEAVAAAARQRAEASDWQRVLPELTGHYLRLLGRESAPVAAAAGKAAQPRFAR